MATKPGRELHRQVGCLMWLEVAAFHFKAYTNVRVRGKDES